MCSVSGGCERVAMLVPVWLPLSVSWPPGACFGVEGVALVVFALLVYTTRRMGTRASDVLVQPAMSGEIRLLDVVFHLANGPRCGEGSFGLCASHVRSRFSPCGGRRLVSFTHSLIGASNISCSTIVDVTVGLSGRFGLPTSCNSLSSH